MSLELPPELEGACRRAFLANPVFSTNTLLSDFFGSRSVLSMYRDLGSVPQRDDPGQRADAVLAFFATRLNQKTPVLALILEGLRDTFPVGDDDYNNLDALARSVRAALTQQEQAPALPTAVVVGAGPPAAPIAAAPTDLGFRDQILFSQLVQIDFDQQIQAVRDAVQDHSLGAFLIHGNPANAPNCGQEVLIKRLFFEWHRDWNPRPIMVDVKVIGASPRALWRVLADYFHLAQDVKQELIIEAIYQALESQDLIFIFKSVEYMLASQPKFLTQWINEFWQTLVARSQDGQVPGPGGNARRRLVCLLVDFQGIVAVAQDVPLAGAKDDVAYPKVPLSLPQIEFFTQEKLDDWLRGPTMQELIPPDLAITAQKLWDQTDGVPWFVYKKICQYCNVDLEGALLTWLTP